MSRVGHEVDKRRLIPIMAFVFSLVESFEMTRVHIGYHGLYRREYIDLCEILTLILGLAVLGLSLTEKGWNSR